ncbi:hypothetical protein EVAR_13044_1 [Eumeta japonica]|uniref:Uncharacterized protein n=1 Tax=Eumeta variegata TaxID=151549 RepID=A0A4C1VJB2_EUMVA|nr:hypothetical protein EVAR_13044_1 [Eumeta japonica]
MDINNPREVTSALQGIKYLMGRELGHWDFKRGNSQSLGEKQQRNSFLTSIIFECSVSYRSSRLIVVLAAKLATAWLHHSKTLWVANGPGGAERPINSTAVSRRVRRGTRAAAARKRAPCDQITPVNGVL